MKQQTFRLLFLISMGIAALLLRILDLGGFLTVDEATTWVPNSYRFLRVLQSGNYASTPFMGHPAITTMWLGTAGVVLRRALFDWGILTTETYPLVLALNRLPIALVTTAGVLLGYGLLRRLVPLSVAMLAAFLWATDPFLIAFSRVLHMDTLLATFATLSLLTASYYWNVIPNSGKELDSRKDATSAKTGQRPDSLYHCSPVFGIKRKTVWWVLSAVLAGLSILSKLPGVVLFPIVAVLAVTALTHTDVISRKGAKTHRSDKELDSVDCSSSESSIMSGQQWLARLKIAVPHVLLWGVICLITIVAVWPTFWTNPVRAYEALRYGIEVEGGSAHLMGNFFLGRPDPTPGPLFYPVALAMRTTPWSLIGLFVLPLAMADARRNLGCHTPLPSMPRHQERQESSAYSSVSTISLATYRTIGMMAGWVILFTLAMSVFPLKFNRYLIPVFPAVDVLAAVGLVWGAERLTRWVASLFPSPTERRVRGGEDMPTTSARTSTVTGIIIASIAFISLINAAWYHPYSIVYFNQLLGGAQAGARTFLIGWGEGTDQVVEWLNKQPDSESVVTVSRMSLVMNPFLRTRAQAYRADGEELPEDAGYLTVYARHTQWNQLLPPYSLFHGHAIPLLVVNLHGVDYAWVYQVPHPMRYDIQADFGSVLQLHGYDVDMTAVQATGTLTLTVQWQARQQMTTDYNVFVHVFDANGERVGQLDVPLLDPRWPPDDDNPPAPTSAWQPGRYIRWIHPVPVAPMDDNADKTYWIALGVYDPATFERLLLQGPAQPGAPDDGENALFLELVRINH